MHWWSRRRPPCCWKAENQQKVRLMSSRGRNCSQLLCACAQRTRRQRFLRCLPTLKTRWLRAIMRQDSSVTSAQAALSRRQERAQPDPVSRWPGLGSTRGATHSTTNWAVSLTVSRLSSSDSAASCRLRKRQTRSRRSPRSLGLPRPSTPGASPKFTSGFAPETCIS